MVEVGYSICPEYQRRGFASEATRALIAHAFASPQVTRVDAETLPELEPSISVMLKCGMRFLGPGSEPGTIRYGVTREEWSA
jgi:RimJ/RimL family protein N-acetyltransferase